MNAPPEKFLFFTAEGLAYSIGESRPGQPPDVWVRLVGAEKAMGISPGISVVLVLSPKEAREAAAGLIRNANAAEAGLPRA